MAKSPSHLTYPASSPMQNITSTQKGPKEVRNGHFMAQRTQRFMFIKRMNENMDVC